MAKRSRLSSRPGQRRPAQRSTAARPESPPPPPDEMPISTRASLTSLEEARAAELEERLVAQEKAAGEAARRARERVRGPGRPETSSVPLSVRAAAEYAYVQRDVKRIVSIAGLLLGLLILLYVLIEVMGIVRV